MARDDVGHSSIHEYCGAIPRIAVEATAGIGGNWAAATTARTFEAGFSKAGRGRHAPQHVLGGGIEKRAC